MSADLERQMTKQRENHEALYDAAMEIKHTVDSHTTKLVDLRYSVEDVKKSVGSLTRDVSGLKRDMSEVKQVLGQHGAALTELRGDMTELRGGMAEILRRLPAND